MPITEAEAAQIIDKVWEVYDADGSGYLDRTEAGKLFRELFSSEGMHLDQEHLDIIINAVDENGDNKISKEEMINLLKDNI